MSSYKWDIVAAVAGLTLAAAGFLYIRGWPPAGAPRTLESWFYLSAYGDAETTSADLGRYGHVLALAAEEGTPTGRVTWTNLGRAAREVSLVFAYRQSLVEQIEDGLPGIAWAMGMDMVHECRVAAAEGVELRGIVLNYASPADSLDEYAALMERVAARCPDKLDLAIFVYPEWLHNPFLPELLRGLDYFILPLNPQDMPGGTASPELFSQSTRLQALLERAETLGVPYYIALDESKTAAPPPDQAAPVTPWLGELERSHLPLLRGLVMCAAPVPAPATETSPSRTP